VELGAIDELHHVMPCKHFDSIHMSSERPLPQGRAILGQTIAHHSHSATHSVRVPAQLLFGPVWTINVNVELLSILCSFIINAFDLTTFPHGSPSNPSDTPRHHFVSVRVAFGVCPTMALVDFYQLAVLHKLSRCNAGSPTHLSHTGSMPTDTQMSSRSPSIEQDQPGTSFPLPTQPEPKTPKRNRNATQSDLRMTPAALGTPAMRQLMHPMVQPPKLKSSRYEEYIVQDFECHRVFIDIDVFMKNVLHVPDDWRELWKKSIEDIKHDQAFISPHMFYGAECAIPGGQEPGFYKHLVDMSNAILDFSAKDSSDESVRLRTPQRYLRNDPKTVSYGIITDLSPDIVAIHKEFLAGGGSRSNLSWAQPLQACEVKPRDGALVDGLCMPRLVVNGERTTTSLAMRF